MWVTMLCTAFLLTDRLWLQIMLIAIASGVTIHLCRVKTLKQKKVLVLFPTEGEAVPFKNMQPSGVTCAITGVGPIESAINTTALIWQHKPDIVILAGIAGTYSGSGLETGDVVLVSNETDADTGSFSEGEFTPKFSLTTYCPYILPRYSLPAVESNSVSAAAAPFIDRGTAAIENMEGAAFFRVCTEAGVRFLELRAVSNTVGEAFCLWNIPLATANLARRLKRIINEV